MILRGPRRADEQTIINNSVIRDERLSYLARGVLAFLLSLSLDEVTDADSLSEMGKESFDEIRRALRELVETGYLRHTEVEGPDGRWRSSFKVIGDAT